MVQVSSGPFGWAVARLGDEPGDDQGLVDIVLVSGGRVTARSADVVIVENHSIAATLLDGLDGFFPPGTAYIEDHVRDAPPAT